MTPRCFICLQNVVKLSTNIMSDCSPAVRRIFGIMKKQVSVENHQIVCGIERKGVNKRWLVVTKHLPLPSMGLMMKFILS